MRAPSPYSPEDWNEVVVYIHGIKDKPESHDRFYRELHQRVRRELEKLGKEKRWPEEPIGVEWGWESGDPEQSEDRYLAAAEEWVGKQTLRAVDQRRDWTFNPARLATGGTRRMFLHGVADMFYYASEAGEKTVRETVFNKIYSRISSMNVPLEMLSLTFICHSAGTVIAHDFLCALFRSQRPSSSEVYLGWLKDMRAMAQDGKIRVRRLYTFGSPITPLIHRSNALLKQFAEGKCLDPRDIGLLPQEDLKGPRWVNFWDKDDILSFPVGPLYGNPETIEDWYCDVSDLLSRAHTAYWVSQKLARKIAATY